MRVFDETKTNELFYYDLEKGYLKADKLFIKHHEEVQAVEEQGHYEVVKVYANFGRDVEWIVDVPSVEGREAWDEYEDIQVYVPYTEEELAKIKQEKYENRVVELIRQKYSLNQELAILRQRDVNYAEFEEYNAYAETCKAIAKAENI